LFLLVLLVCCFYTWSFKPACSEGSQAGFELGALSQSDCHQSSFLLFTFYFLLEA
jgi:hypothetical protein